MPFYHPNRRKIYGVEQLEESYELLTSTEYAKRFSYTRDGVVKKCRKKQLKAFKVAGEWRIVTLKET